MGTSGNKPGYKVFSINTTIRNPRRNTEFLEVLQDFDNKELTKDTKKCIYIELIRRGIYKVSNLESVVKEKYEDNVLLEDEEIYQIIDNNPQKTGDEGRLMTQIRALKDTGFVNLIGPRNKKVLQITPLGRALLNNENVEDIYSKAMIGLHSNNPQRDTIYNKARPFLNTLFVIKEINEHYNNKKGILWHEFAFFVLSMKDCDYKKVAEEIIKYRNEYGHKINQLYLENYIYNEVKVNKIKFKSILKDYADDVYRKFNMTGLIFSHGFGENTYISYTPYYIEKVNSIIEEYKDYQFNEFETTEEYTNYLTNINLPWEKSEEIKKKIIKNQKEALNIKINEEVSLDEQMKKLNSIYNKRVFANFVENISKGEIIRELILLSRNQGEKSAFSDVPNSVRLEWFIAMYTAKIYGTKYVNPNLILDNKGIPKSFAPGGKADIELDAEGLYCLIEVTLMRDYKQQLNSETTSIADHLNSLDVDKNKCSLMIAPFVHYRVVQFFNFINNAENTTIVASTIEHYIESTKDNNSINDFITFIYNLKEFMNDNEDKEYCDEINFTKVEESITYK